MHEETVSADIENDPIADYFVGRLRKFQNATRLMRHFTSSASPLLALVGCAA